VQSCIDAHTDPSLIHSSSVTDKAANVKGASDILTGEDKKFCINHEIKKVIDDCLIGTPATLATAPLAAKIFSFVSDVSGSIRADKLEKNLFEKIQNSNGDTCALQTIVDNLTRWEGKYSRIKRFLDLKKPLKQLCNDSRSSFKTSWNGRTDFNANSSILSGSFWMNVKQITELMAVFHVVSKKAQAEKVVTLSSIPFWFHTLQTACVLDDKACVRELKSAL
jgi:hypothetical protein